ncbi:branched-chain amino acid ABC transporter permease [Variovorax sp. Sphag1AA]|uniref:branched-chain amino acid ABC transporter permease n=1 Tax=Variovorax sp. Sphag1AA TaxID=2587027 RepID=UPI001609988D|nr:branched-chain amino acid ABC transporter permease [Variovorax sp. Sphag1AA]MBB3180140.1 branched-chain amino acid transport system permease protein [Variovorax sp. Sphag1AA]
MKAQFANRPWLVLGIGVALAACIPWLASDFVASVALSCLMYIALATSWSLFCGATRYLSLATSAFFGLGAYASAMLLEVLPWPLVILSGALLASVIAVLMGSAVLHLRGTYFAVLTFGMTELIRHAVTFVEKQVSGTVGRVLVVVPSNETVYLTVLAIAAGAIATAIIVKRSRFGLALAGVGADEQRAQTLGVDTRRIKIAGFALTAAFAGAVGAAMAVRWTYIEPPAVFSPFIGFQTVLIALIGGAASIGGPVVAAIVFSLLAEALRLQLPYGYMMVLGLLLILCVMYLPNGLASLWQRNGARRRGNG